MDEILSLQEFHLTQNMTTDVRYADDTTLISSLMEKLGFSTQELENVCNKWGLKINTSKCKVISPDPFSDVLIEEEAVEKVESFVFLGSVVPNMLKEG